MFPADHHFRADGGASAGAAEIAGAADRTETIADDDRFRPSWSPAIYLLFIALPLIGMVMMYWRGNPGMPLV